ncbi:MAG: uracil phosphoribosyltransferase [Coriobacteriales bacterium]|jgi:uracil phosphoribosyltransferase|nr:uracil phosphoribosyltransferase [Coriobacteriales bacterium]
MSEINANNYPDQVTVVDHPMVQHKLSILRDKETSPKLFRELVKELALFLSYEATRGFELEPIEIETPICQMTAYTLKGRKVAVVPILRAGLGMVEGVQEMIPAARIGHIGLYRDPDTHLPVEYYCKLPEDIDTRDVLIVDPMLATGGSAVAAINFIKARNVASEKIRFLAIIAAPEGIKAMDEADPNIKIYTCAIDECLNEHAYIVPGLGDAGDRIFGTK